TPWPLFCANAPDSTELYPLSLHDALPISEREHLAHQYLQPPDVPLGDADQQRVLVAVVVIERRLGKSAGFGDLVHRGGRIAAPRSEEHTSELQSRENLVCRLLLEKKKKTQ